MPSRLIQLIIILFASNIAYTQCEICLEQVNLLGRQITSLNLSFTKVVVQRDSLNNHITNLTNEITLYKSGLKYPIARLPNQIKPIEIKSLPINSGHSPSSPKTIYSDQNKELQESIKKFKKNISDLNRKILAAKSTISSQKNDIASLNKDISNLNKIVLDQQEINSKLIVEKAKLESIITCIKLFESEIKRPAPNIVKELVEARKDFIEYKRLKLVKSTKKSQMEMLLDRVISTYDTYKGNQREMNCGDISLSVFQDYLTIEDYFNIAEIYCKNYGNAVQKIKTDNQINEANRRILNAVAIIMEKGSYDQRTEMANSLERCISRETRPGSVNAEVISNFKEINTLYEDGKFIEALTLYDKNQKFSDLEQLDKLLVIKAKAYIGQIVLWDLANLGENISKFINGEWLDCSINSTECKKSLLEEIVKTDIKNFSKDDQSELLSLKKQAQLSLIKYYE